MNFNNGDAVLTLMFVFITGIVSGVVSVMISYSLFLIYAKKRLESFIKTGKNVLFKQQNQGYHSTKSSEYIPPLNELIPLNSGKRTDVTLSSKEEQELFSEKMNEAKRDHTIARLNHKSKKNS